MKPLKSLRTTDSYNPGWLRRLVRCRRGTYRILFARNSVFECYSPNCGRIKGEIFAWIYRMKGDGRDAIVVDAPKHKCEICNGDGFYLLAELGGEKQYARCDCKTPNAGAEAPAN
jgi:hypothetical protein